MNIWFTADTHFGHANIINYSRRPWATVAEMDEALIERWNERVKPGDLVHHLGDVFWKNRISQYLPRLNGRIEVCLGNHDREGTLRGAGLVVRDVFTFRHRDINIWLSHYPHLTWPGSFHGSLHLFGHEHGQVNHLARERSMDVGVDCHDYRPLHLDDVIERLK